MVGVAVAVGVAVGVGVAVVVVVGVGVGVVVGVVVAVGVAMKAMIDAALGLHKDTPYVPWALDLHHLSATFAFMCAAGCGVMLVKYF